MNMFRSFPRDNSYHFPCVPFRVCMNILGQLFQKSFCLFLSFFQQTNRQDLFQWRRCFCAVHGHCFFQARHSNTVIIVNLVWLQPSRYPTFDFIFLDFAAVITFTRISTAGSCCWWLRWRRYSHSIRCDFTSALLVGSICCLATGPSSSPSICGQTSGSIASQLVYY